MDFKNREILASAFNHPQLLITDSSGLTIVAIALSPHFQAPTVLCVQLFLCDVYIEFFQSRKSVFCYICHKH